MLHSYFKWFKYCREQSQRCTLKIDEACNVIKKEALGQVFSCELYKIFKNTFFIEHNQVIVSVLLLSKNHWTWILFISKLKLDWVHGRILKGIVRSFHQKKSKKNFFLCDCDVSCIKLYISVVTLWKKKKNE